jgi:hypothetical protein
VKVFTDFASDSPDPFNRSIVWFGNLFTSYNQRLWRSDGFGMSDETSKLAGIGGKRAGGGGLRDQPEASS